MSSGSFILLVDDDEAFRSTLARALNRRGFSCVTAASVAEARAVLQQQTPIAAVVDLRMPGELGLVLIRELRQLSGEMRILMLTAYGSIATAVEAVRQGADDYILKPVDGSQVLEVLFPKELRDDSEADSRMSSVISSSNSLEQASLAQVEWEHIQKALLECDGNVTHAAKMLGLHRRSLQRKLEKPPGKLLLK